MAPTKKVVAAWVMLVLLAVARVQMVKGWTREEKDMFKRCFKKDCCRNFFFQCLRDHFTVEEAIYAASCACGLLIPPPDWCDY